LPGSSKAAAFAAAFFRLVVNRGTESQLLIQSLNRSSGFLDWNCCRDALGRVQIQLTARDFVQKLLSECNTC
jgi:hypothetical protein